MRLAMDGDLPRKILLADDNEINRTIIEKMLELEDIRPDIAKNGLEALQAVEREEYALILMDCQMPVMDGYKAAQTIRERESRGKHIPIVAMTADETPEERLKCLASGMDDYLGKPFTRGDIVHLLRKYRVLEDQRITLTEGDEKRSGESADDPEEVICWLVHEAGFSAQDAHKLLFRFIEGLRKDYTAIISCLERGKREEAAALLHKLKGSSGNLAMTVLCEAVSELEAILRGNSAGDEMHSMERLKKYMEQV